MSILPEQISTFDYYVKKLPLYLQRSEGFQEHFRIWYDILVGKSSITGIKGICDSVLELLNIFDDNYLDYIASFEGSGVTEENKYGDKSDILDKIGLLFGVKRSFSINYTESGTSYYNEFINLNNEEFLIFIKFQIIKNACEGTREQIDSFYASTGLSIYLINQTMSASVDIYLETREGFSSNLKKLFLAGELILKSMGIEYSYSEIDVDGLLYWDQINDEKTNGWSNEDLTNPQGGLWII